MADKLTHAHTGTTGSSGEGGGDKNSNSTCATTHTHPQLGKQPDGVGAAVLGQRAWDDLQGLTHRTEGPLLHALERLGALSKGCSVQSGRKAHTTHGNTERRVRQGGQKLFGAHVYCTSSVLQHELI